MLLNGCNQTHCLDFNLSATTLFNAACDGSRIVVAPQSPRERVGSQSASRAAHEGPVAAEGLGHGTQPEGKAN